ncbi:MAG: AMP-binding protein, partial [Verrucomicrobia bacterium]|nr:AMP-binding protein [Verrucomicrobiota bacterium]
VGGALTNIAVTLSGRVPVNLNFTASREALAYAIKQSDLRTIVSSRAFIEKLENFSPPSGLLFLEDLLPRISTRNRLSALLAARCAPARWLMCHRRPTPDDLATIIFSSGSTGLPKGVMLTHHNLLSNVEAFASVFGFEHTDRVCAILPLFHSFGFTATLWCPMILGFRAHYHPNPLDSAKITEVVRTERLTVLLTTPTFLLAYIRRAKREDFASLRSVITGAEKLKTRVADAFAEQFGIRPLEGYGSTELSPVVSINLPDYVRGGVAQTGTKPGSTGHPLPGIAVRITDPETGATLPIGADGLVRVKGPNVMRGYLNDPARTAEALHDGWYNTGDIGHIDEDGFIFLVDRLARFSKIGGEMVPHVGVEEKIMAGLDATQASIAVTAAPDERKGEQLVVIFTAAAGDAASLQRLVKESDLPNLWKPREGNFVRVDALPVLGTGKLDLRKLKEIARAHVEGRAEKN